MPDYDEIAGDDAELRALLEEFDAGHPAPTPRTVTLTGFFADDVPDAEVSDAAAKVNEAWATIGIKEIYDAFSKGVYASGDERRTSGEVKVSCPNPSHPDKNPSCSMNLDTDMYACYVCMDKGTDKAAMAAVSMGIPLPVGARFFEVKKAVVKRLRGVDYDAMTTPPMPVLAPATVPPSTAGPMPGVTATTTVAEGEDAYERAVRAATSRELINREARRRAKQLEGQALFTPPAFSILADELDEPDPVVEWTIEGLHAVGTNSTITAGYKTGKSTLMRNLVKALVDGEPFLGEHAVRALTGRIAYFNYEIEQVQMKRDLRDMGIVHSERIVMVHLRGTHLDLMDDITFEHVASQLKAQEVEALILDPYSGAYYGDENDNSEVNAFTKRLDELKRVAGVSDLFMPAHTGRGEGTEERARGAAKLDDWTDNRWVLVRDAETSSRYFKAEGRRVEQAERELTFDRVTNALAYSGAGSRKDRVVSSTKTKILNLVALKPGCTTNDIITAVGGNKDATRKVLKKLIDELQIDTRPASRGAIAHYVPGAAPTGM